MMRVVNFKKPAPPSKIVVERVIRSSRKTISLEVHNGGKVFVRAPWNATDKRINEFIKSQADWLKEKQKELEYKIKEPLKFKNNETVFYRGKEYKIKIGLTARKIRLHKGNIIMPDLDSAKLKEMLIGWYKEKCVEIIDDRTRKLAGKLHKRLYKIKITSAKKRWGSCTPKGHINFAWRLIMAPDPVINYVITHEVMHLFELNHSKRFWKLVAKHCPNYKIYENWLDENGWQLDI